MLQLGEAGCSQAEAPPSQDAQPPSPGLSPSHLDAQSDPQAPSLAAGTTAQAASSDRPPQLSIQELLEEYAPRTGKYAVKPGDPAERVAKAVDHIYAGCHGNADAMSSMASKMAQSMKSESTAPHAQHNGENNFWEELKESNFFFNTGGAKGNPMAGRWQRFLKGSPEEKEKYDQTKGQKAKAEFRQRWAQLRYKDYIEAKEHTKTWETVDTSKGHYYSVARIAQEEGGGEMGWKAAINYSLRAFGMGPPWFEFDSWTQQVKFLYMIKGYEENFKKSWLTVKSWSSTSSNDAPAVAGKGRDLESGASLAAVAGAGTNEGQQKPDGCNPHQTPTKAKSKATAKGKAKSEPSPKPDTSGKRSTSEMATIMSQAKKAKIDYNSTISQAGTISTNIQNDPKWKWATHESINGDFYEAKSKIEKAVQDNTFVKAALTNELSDLRGDYKAAELQTELVRFKDTLQPLVQDLACACRVLVRQHKARQVHG